MPSSTKLTGFPYEQNSDSLWNELHAAGLREHDRFWRMPLDEEYGPQIYNGMADLCNVSHCVPSRVSVCFVPSATSPGLVERVRAVLLNTSVSAFAIVVLGTAT